MSKLKQYYEYLAYGGSMTIEEWEQDGRFDEALAREAHEREKEQIEQDYFDDDFDRDEYDLGEEMIEREGVNADNNGWY